MTTSWLHNAAAFHPTCTTGGCTHPAAAHQLCTQHLADAAERWRNRALSLERDHGRLLAAVRRLLRVLRDPGPIDTGDAGDRYRSQLGDAIATTDRAANGGTP